MRGGFFHFAGAAAPLPAATPDFPWEVGL